MATKDVAEMTAQVLAHLKTGKFCNGYPMPGSNFTKEKMDAAKAAGVKGPPKSAKRQGTVKLGGLTL